jgi:hypothetical protein
VKKTLALQVHPDGGRGGGRMKERGGGGLEGGSGSGRCQSVVDNLSTRREGGVQGRGVATFSSASEAKQAA